MAATQRMGDQSRSAAFIAASALAHALLIALLVWRAGQAPILPEAPQPPAILIEIEPRPLIRDETPRPRPAPPQPSTAPRTAVAGQAGPIAPPRPRDEDEDRPSAPSPRQAAPAPAGAPASPAVDDPWRLRPETTGQAVARSLRTSPIGCANARRLNAVEQAVCAERLGEAADRAAPITGSGNAARDARFAREGAAALAAYESRRRPASGGVGVSGISPDCPGGNLRGTCAGAHLPGHYQPDESNPRR
jgi:type IV secretory pathway VirB10-like protein